MHLSGRQSNHTSKFRTIRELSFYLTVCVQSYMSKMYTCIYYRHEKKNAFNLKAKVCRFLKRNNPWNIFETLQIRKMPMQIQLDALTQMFLKW